MFITLLRGGEQMRNGNGPKNLLDAIFIENKISVVTLSLAYNKGLKDKKEKVYFAHARQIRKTDTNSRSRPFNSDFLRDLNYSHKFNHH